MFLNVFDTLMVNDPDRSDSNNEPGGFCQNLKTLVCNKCVVGIPKLPISVPLRIPFCVDMANMGKSFVGGPTHSSAFHGCAEVSSDLFIFKGQMDLATCLMYLHTVGEHIIRITKYNNTVIYIYIIYVCISYM